MHVIILNAYNEKYAYGVIIYRVDNLDEFSLINILSIYTSYLLGIREALNYMPGDRLIVAPDCGLGLLPKDSLHQKLSNMMQAVKELRREIYSS